MPQIHELTGWEDDRPINFPPSLHLGSWTTEVKLGTNPRTSEVTGWVTQYLGYLREQSAEARRHYAYNWGTPADDVLSLFAVFTPADPDFPLRTGANLHFTRRWNQEGEGASYQLNDYGVPITGIITDISMWLGNESTNRETLRNSIGDGTTWETPITGFSFSTLNRELDRLIHDSYGRIVSQLDYQSSIIRPWFEAFIDEYQNCFLCHENRCQFPNVGDEHHWCGNDEYDEGFHFTSIPQRDLHFEPGIDLERLGELNYTNDEIVSSTQPWCSRCRGNQSNPPSVFYMEGDNWGIGPCTQCGNVLILAGQHMLDESSRRWHPGNIPTNLCWACWITHFDWCPRCNNISYSRELHRCNQCSRLTRSARGSSEDMFRRVNNYTFRPELVFFPDDPPIPERPLYIGLEVEISFDGGDYQEVLNDWIPNLEPRMIYAKSDISVTTGIELVTYPFSPEWAKENFPLSEFDRLIEEFNARPNHASTGTHIHMSKAAFTQAHLWKFLHLHSELSTFLGGLGGRGTNAGYGSFELDVPSEKRHRLEFVKNKNQPYQWGIERSRAVNLINADTIELRYPRGGCTSDEVGKNIDLAQALYDFTDYVNIGDARDGAFDDPGFLLKWIQSGSYPYLNKWIQAEMPNPKALKKRSRS